MPQDEFDTIIQDVRSAPEATRLLKPVPVRARRRAQEPHPVIWFARGTALWLFAALELSVLLWFWHLHG
jgi:hypothetical protein